MEGENDEFLYDEDSPEETKFAYSIRLEQLSLKYALLVYSN